MYIFIYMILVNTYTYMHIYIVYWRRFTYRLSLKYRQIHANSSRYLQIHINTNPPPTYRHIHAHVTQSTQAMSGFLYKMQGVP